MCILACYRSYWCRLLSPLQTSLSRRRIRSLPEVSSACSFRGRRVLRAGASFLLRRASASLLRQVRLRVASAGRPVGLRTARGGGILSSMAQWRPLKIFPTLHVRSPYPRSDMTQNLINGESTRGRDAPGYGWMCGSVVVTPPVAPLLKGSRTSP